MGSSVFHSKFRFHQNLWLKSHAKNKWMKSSTLASS
jgi:hypothetical protein